MVSGLLRSPLNKQHANNNIPALIADTISLPSLLLLRRKSYLEQLYTRKNLSIREIAQLADVSSSAVVAAMRRFKIAQAGSRHKLRGQIPFGYDYIDYNPVRNKEEQNIIRTIRQYRAGGFSLCHIAKELNRRLVPTENTWVWQANTVKQILDRV